MARPTKKLNKLCPRCDSEIRPSFGTATCKECDEELCVEFCIPSGRFTMCLNCEEANTLDEDKE